MVDSGLRKIRKKNPIKDIVLKTPPKLTGGIFLFGRIGSGKTVSMLSLAGIYHDNPQRKYKIFDVWGGDRNEHLYWTLPSNKTAYWNIVKRSLMLDKEGPKQYETNLLYPLYKAKMFKQLPKTDHVHPKLFTIPIQDLTLQDFSLILGNVSDSSAGRWKDTIAEAKKKDSVAKVLKIYRSKGGTNDLLYKNILLPLSKNLLFQDNQCIYNLNIKDEVSAQEIISILCLDYIEKEERLLIMGYLLRKISEELDRKHRRVIGIIREASEFFRAKDQTVVEDRYKVARLAISQWIRMGRRGLHLFLDSQSPAETSGFLQGQEDLRLLGRLPGEADRKQATDQLKRDGKISSNQIKSLSDNPPGKFVICPGGGHAYTSYLLLPRCRFWEETNGNFYKNIWAKEVGTWTSFIDERDRLAEKFKEQMKDEEDKRKKKKEDINEEDLFNEIKIKDSNIEDQEQEEETENKPMEIDLEW
jgi:hypothetical protein